MTNAIKQSNINNLKVSRLEGGVLNVKVKFNIASTRKFK